MSDGLFAPGYKTEPFWWDQTPRPSAIKDGLPERADVVVIGSGYTGLCAALQTVRGGRDTVVIDAESIGWGCSTRNGGQVATGIEASFADLTRKFGEKLGYDIAREGHNALEWIAEFVESESIDCNFRRCGRFYGAHSRRSFDWLSNEYGKPPPKGLETDCYVVPPGDHYQDVGTDFYRGGVVHPRHAAVDPARLHDGILRRVSDAGARIVGNCRALHIERTAGQFQIDTSQGRIIARDVVVATNGYTGDATPWMRNRIIPLGSYILATEPLNDQLIQRLLPSDRVIIDTREMVVYYRTCPDRNRLVFGGRVSVSEPDAHVMAPALHGEMVRIFPDLAATQITHMWMGFVGFSFDFLPHMGRHDGVYYAMGYCGSGISLAGYMGTKIGQQILGLAEGDSPLSQPRFESRFYYWGKPWFMRPALAYYKLRDRFG